MARMPGKAHPDWCWVCHSTPGLDCPSRGKSPRQVRRELKRELEREVLDAQSPEEVR